MATLLKYKKGLKRPTLAWNEMSFVTTDTERPRNTACQEETDTDRQRNTIC